MKHHKLFWGSSYDRGLDILLEMWPTIIKNYPDATLDVCYGWELFDVAYSNNKERQAWKQRQEQLMTLPGITHHGRVGQYELKQIRSQCGIWAYPTYFTEINCITALECQNDGLVPVCTSLGALEETAKTGLLVDGDIYDKQIKDNYLTVLLDLMSDKKEWKRLSNKCQKFARKYDWLNISSQWDLSPVDYSDKKITVYTPTIRDGWWNIMASNLAEQTHKNFEWLIVDGQKESRREIADKYAKEYGLDIKYIHQGKTKRTYGLSNANNIAIANAEGYLLVFLQDFVLLPATALEELIRVSMKHPGDFIAPVDTYFAPKVKANLENKEDWFDGNFDIIGKFIRKNIRLQNQGIRKSDVVTDFEQNYGAVPLETLKELNGYYEFFDEALGWDDTEIIYRAQALGYNVIIDDTNQCVCIDHDTILENSRKTSRRDNTPRYVWMVDQIKKGNLPVVRDIEIEKNIDLQYTIPETVDDDKIDMWIRANLANIIKPWGDV